MFDLCLFSHCKDGLHKRETQFEVSIPPAGNDEDVPRPQEDLLTDR